MTRATLETMWSVITRRKAVLQKYLAEKARLIGERARLVRHQAPWQGRRTGPVGGISFDAGPTS